MQTSDEGSNACPVTLPQSSRPSWQADKSFLVCFRMAGAFSVLLVFNKNQLSQPSGKRKGKQIEFTWPLPNTLCCIMAEHEAETNSKSNNQNPSTSTWEAGEMHGSRPPLLRGDWVTSAHTASPSLTPLLSCAVFLHKSHTRSVPNRLHHRQEHVAVGPFLLNAGLPEGLLRENSVPAPTPAQRFYQRRDLEGHPAPTRSQAPLDKCSHKYLFFKEKKKIITRILFNIKY